MYPKLIIFNYKIEKLLLILKWAIIHVTFFFFGEKIIHVTLLCDFKTYKLNNLWKKFVIIDLLNVITGYPFFFLTRDNLLFANKYQFKNPHGA